ncbi:lebercilin-like isoform X1 [Mytilus edulis]|uniref:lebercilin-like isoform X1 n=1 Tax=Mytilus edulis TaxID=6550 RepID=UPI0039EEC35B
MASRYNGHKDKDDYDDYDYSDSFVSDEDDESVKKQSPQTRKVAQVTARKKPPTNRGHKGRISSRATAQSQEPKVDNAVQRMLSSKNLRINELKNQLQDFRLNLDEMKEENKLLKKTQKRQEKALGKFENEESDIPQLLQRHNNEVRTLREQLKKTQDKYQRTDRYLRDAEDELDKTKNKLKKYKNLAEDKNLLERQELQKKVQQTEIDLEEKDVKVRELEKHINHLNKNHRHELGIEIARHRDFQKQMESLRNDNEELQNRLKEKVKAVELANIYSLRKGKKLPASYSGTPNRTPPPGRRKRNPSLHDITPREKMKMFEDKRKEEERLQREFQRGDGPKMAFQTAGSSNRSIHKNKESKKQPNLTYRSTQNNSFDKDREFDSKKTSNDLNSSYDKGHSGTNYSSEPHGYDYSTTQEKKHRTVRQKEKISANPTFLTESNEYSPSQPNSDRQPKQQERHKRDREEQLRQRAEEDDRRRQRERDDQEMRELEQLEQERRQRESRDREEQRKRDQEAEEWMKKMEGEKRQRESEEHRVREEQQRKEREERERRDKERHEQERRARDEKDRMEMDVQLAEERMKKDELLKKLRLIDEGQNKQEEKKTTGGGSELFFVTSNKQRRDSDAGSATSSKKSSYSFTKPVENMHHGKPARDDVTVPYIERQKKHSPPVGGYQPSFGMSSGITGGGKKTKKSTGQVIFDDYDKDDKAKKPPINKKGDLMSELFGNQASKPTKSTDLDSSEDVFKPPVRNTKTTATKTSGFPWEDNNKKSTTTNSLMGERASSLFGGGGSGILDDNDSSVFDSSKMLPKRGRQPNTTFQAKPAVSAIDHSHFDDDIEEVML